MSNDYCTRHFDAATKPIHILTGHEQQDDYTADTGTILFGGIDITKFIGPLNTIDVVPLQGQDARSHFSVRLGSIVANYSASGGDDSQDLYDSSGAALRVLLDSGTTISYLPAQLVASIWKYFGVRDDRANTGVGLVDCNLATRMVGLTIDFHFLSGDNDNTSVTIATNAAAAENRRPVIKVPFGEFILNNINSDSNITLPADLGFEKVCSFGLLDSPGGGVGALSILGQNFLRSAYVVYDLEHHEVGLAQANLDNSGGSSSSGGGIVEITEDEGIPSVTGAGGVGAGGPTTSSSSGGGGGGGGGGPQPTGSQQNGAADSWRRQEASTAMVVAAAGMLISVWVFPALLW